MNQQNSRIIWAAAAISAFVGPFVFFSSHLDPWSRQDFLPSFVQEAIYPVEYVGHKIFTKLERGWDRYLSFQDRSATEQELRTQLARMQTRIIDYDEQVHENERLRSYLGFRERFDHKLVVAEVIAKDPSSPFGSLRVDRGQLDGVRIGMPVVTADGLVGKVIRVGIKFADIQLATDSNFYLDILLQRTRVRGVLRGASGNRCLLRLHRRAEIRIGDRIITSGIIGGFVKGLPVGKIVRISYDSDNVSQTVAVEPWVNFGKLEEVMILFANDPEVEKITDTAGEEWLKSAMKDANNDRTSRE